MNCCSLTFAIVLQAASATVGFAEVTSGSACAYFASNLKLESFERDVLQAPPSGLTFVNLSTELERYQLTQADNVLQEFGAITDSGYQSRGVTSASITCLSDIVDRRVIYLAVAAGKAVGGDIETDVGKRKVRPAEVLLIDIGGLSHAGKY